MQRDWSKYARKQGLLIDAAVSPNSGRHTDKLELILKAADGSWRYCRSTVTFATATEMDAMALFESIPVVSCSQCGTDTIDEQALCEPCRLAKIDEDLRVAQEKERKETEAFDREQLRQGKTHKAACWVHPVRGDDFRVDLYFEGEPTEAEVREILRKDHQSRVLDDFSIFPMKKH